MKGFFRWFKSGAKMKRWMFLLLCSIVLVGYGISLVIQRKTLQTEEIIKIAVSFALGFTLIIVSIIHMQKRMLELLVEESDTRKEKNNVKSLIFNKKVYNQGPKVVVIGGGSGLNAVLRGLKNYTDNITAIVTVSDCEEDALKNKNDTTLDDVKGSIAALAYNEEAIKSLLDYNYEVRPFKKYTFADMYFLAMTGVHGSFAKSVENSKNVFNITGKVLPVTLDPIKICAELEDGTVIEDRNRIPRIAKDSERKIARTFIYPTNSQPAPGVLDAIKEADAVVIGPGSLYTNVIPNLLVRGVARTIKESKAMKIYISNIMTESGQTDNFTLSDYIKTIQDYLGDGMIDYCIYDTGEIVPEYIQKYNSEGSDIVIPDTTKAKHLGVKLIQRNLSSIYDDTIRHDSDIIASTIIQLLCDELAFADMENNIQYMKLNKQLKESKREIRKRKKQEKKFRKSGKKQFEPRDKSSKSKFRNKYNKRIKSIKESDKEKNKIRMSNEILKDKEEVTK